MCIYIYIYVYICWCVCVCACASVLWVCGFVRARARTCARATLASSSPNDFLYADPETGGKGPKSQLHRRCLSQLAQLDHRMQLQMPHVVILDFASLVQFLTSTPDCMQRGRDERRLLLAPKADVGYKQITPLQSVLWPRGVASMQYACV